MIKNYTSETHIRGTQCTIYGVYTLKFTKRVINLMSYPVLLLPPLFAMFSCYRTGDLPVSEGAASRSRYDVKAAEEDENRRESRSGSLSVRVHEQSGIWEQAPSYGTTHEGFDQSLGRQCFELGKQNSELGCFQIPKLVF